MVGIKVECLAKGTFQPVVQIEYFDSYARAFDRKNCPTWFRDSGYKALSQIVEQNKLVSSLLLK